MKGQLVTSLGRFQPRTFAVKLAQPSVKLTPPQSSPIELPYDLAVANRDGERMKSGFDGEGFALPAEMLPRELAYAGIVFHLAPATERMRWWRVGRIFQCLLVCEGLYVLAASAGGDQNVAFRVGSESVNVTIQNWSGFIGQWDDRQWKETEVRLQPRTTPPDIPPDIAALLQRSRTQTRPLWRDGWHHAGLHQTRAARVVRVASTHAGWYE